ncbi:MAG TPA: PIN domain-containing protein [Solirubrobacteraceae bacterium]|nr:PIN domain-containing protein [Solirubrobacteraceae bacterium]
MIATVLVDTNVFTARLRERSPLATSYAKHLFGQRIAVAPQTVAEARYGALSANWGTARMERLSRLIARARILPVDIDTIEAVARLRNECRQIGHGLHQRGHNADLWIAATAIRWHIPLVAHDAVFDGCPSLELRTELDTRPTD